MKIKALRLAKLPIAIQEAALVRAHRLAVTPAEHQALDLIEARLVELRSPRPPDDAPAISLEQLQALLGKRVLLRCRTERGERHVVAGQLTQVFSLHEPEEQVVKLGPLFPELSSWAQRPDETPCVPYVHGDGEKLLHFGPRARLGILSEATETASLRCPVFATVDSGERSPLAREVSAGLDRGEAIPLTPKFPGNMEAPRTEEDGAAERKAHRFGYQAVAIRDVTLRMPSLDSLREQVKKSVLTGTDAYDAARQAIENAFKAAMQELVEEPHAASGRVVRGLLANGGVGLDLMRKGLHSGMSAAQQHAQVIVAFHAAQGRVLHPDEQIQLLHGSRSFLHRMANAHDAIESAMKSHLTRKGPAWDANDFAAQGAGETASVLPSEETERLFAERYGATLETSLKGTFGCPARHVLGGTSAFNQLLELHEAVLRVALQTAQLRDSAELPRVASEL